MMLSKKLSLYFVLGLSILMLSCKSKSNVVTSKTPKKTKTYTIKTTDSHTIPSKPKDNTPNTPNVSSKSSDKVVRKALTYKGTRYKYGGTTKSGIDCSGLMFVSFKSNNITLPRTSYEQSKRGQRISARAIRKGDLVFFKTGRKNKINHVGLIVSVNGSDKKFIHSSSSRGVMISSLKEGYWSNAFVEARRVLESSSNTNSTSSQPTTNHNSYTVKKGDTLYSIARRYDGISVNDIMSANKLQSTSLTPGMILKIPAK